MNQIIFIIIGLVLGFFACAIIFLFFVRKPKEENLMIQEQLKEIRSTLDMKLGESTKAMQEQFGHSFKVIRDVTSQLEKIHSDHEHVKDMKGSLERLTDVLANPKQRGVLGEYYLETVLKNVLPPGRFQMQYKFQDGEIVDAVIFLDKNKILPVDSKFSLENYNRILEEKNEANRENLEKLFKQDLKNRIDETSKYIRPKEDTMDFAFMFIPSEAIYYDLLINQVGTVKTNTRDLIEYAFQQKHVIIVSPTSFMAYLQTVLQGLRALQIEESAKEIRKRVEELGRHLGNYEQFMKKLGVNLATTINTYNTSYKELGKIDKDVLHITGEAVGIESKLLDKPEEIE